MTAREDQPQLGTCKFWPFLQHARDVCCVDWKPVVTEDQPRPTLATGEKCPTCGCHKRHHKWPTIRNKNEIGEAQGEAPPDALAERIGYKIQSLLTDKYTNSLKIAVGIIAQELGAGARSTPSLPCRIEVERETDGRWIVEIMDCPGAMAYGASPQEALEKALEISGSTPSPDPPPKCSTCGIAMVPDGRGSFICGNNRCMSPYLKPIAVLAPSLPTKEKK